MAMHLDRRAVLLGGLPLGFAAAKAVCGDRERIPIADMHSHLFFIGPAPASLHPLGKSMAEGNTTLVAWSLVGDLLWLKSTKRGLQQNGTPRPGEAIDFFRAEISRMKAHAASQGLRIALTPGDIQRAREGERHIVLAIEGATFLDEDPALLKVAYDAGVRHVQLVHYSRNKLADFQTERPALGGLTELGRKVVTDCNRLGIVVDLAHATSEAIQQALAVSKVPMIFSHGSVTRSQQPSWTQSATQARRLDIDTARMVAKAGGVVGLWALRSDIGGGIDAYAGRLLEMANWLGDDHVGFGSDLNAIRNPSISSYRDLRRVVDLWQRSGIDTVRITKLAFGNYARVLRQAMEAGAI